MTCRGQKTPKRKETGKWKFGNRASNRGSVKSIFTPMQTTSGTNVNDTLNQAIIENHLNLKNSLVYSQLYGLNYPEEDQTNLDKEFATIIELIDWLSSAVRRTTGSSNSSLHERRSRRHSRYTGLV